MDAGRGSYLAGIVNHASYDDLKGCLASIARQTRAPCRIHVVDTGVDPERLEALARVLPSVRFEIRPNGGWGAGVNRILDEMRREPGTPEFALVLNPDLELEPDFAEALLRALETRPRVALASGKLMRPGGRVIDSAGIRLPRHRRPRDRGSGEVDRGQYDRPEAVFGVSGAAMWIRCAALDDLAVDGEIVDEDFFLYHDDTDLCWRAHRLGWEVFYEPAARAVHGRRWQRERRMEIARSVRRHSFKNHYLEIVKNERGRDLLINLPWLLSWEVLRLGFALLRDRDVLPAYGQALRCLPGAWAKRRTIQAKASARRDGPASGEPAPGDGSTVPVRLDR